IESEQERLSARSYELDGELRQVQNLLGQTALDLDRAENRITFNREQVAQIDTRATRLVVELEQAERQAAELGARMLAQREAARSLREQTAILEVALRQTTEQTASSTVEQEGLEVRIAELRQLAARMVEESAREQAESVQAEETAARYTAAEEQRGAELRAMEAEYAALTEKVAGAEKTFQQAETQAHDLGKAVHDSQSRLGELRVNQNEASQRLEGVRGRLSAEQ